MAGVVVIILAVQLLALEGGDEFMANYQKHSGQGFHDFSIKK
ncbi:hypothetical protein [Vibrio azureus]|nr:hypothetical protein [Vibrio azureus]